MFGKHGEKYNESEELYISQDNFLAWATETAVAQPVSLLRSVLSCGFDLQFQVSYPFDTDYISKISKLCTPEVDKTIVKFVNNVCRTRGVSSSRIFAQEMGLTSEDRLDPAYACLINIPIEYLRLRFAFLQVINTSITKHLLPAVSFTPMHIYSHSLSSLLLRARDYLFYDVKLSYLHFIIDSTAKRSVDNVPPEIIFDPMEFIHQADREFNNTVTMLAKKQLARCPSQELCVRLASGGDPVFSFNVKLTGETVQGTSGSFRYFMWLVAQELQTASFPVLIECPSASANENKGRFLLRPKNLDYEDEGLLQFIGVILGVAIRSDVPFAIDCLRPFWTRLLGEELDFETDLAESDIITHNFIRSLRALKSEKELKELIIETCPTHFKTEGCAPSCPYKFNYSSLDGSDVVLKAGSPSVQWSNLPQFIDAICDLRRRELNADNIIPVIQCGLASIVPLETLHLLGPSDIELRTCGQQYIDIGFIRLHTIYQVGISATDRHIEFFWNVVESLSQEDLRKLIKFACNQERIPFSCPCQVCCFRTLVFVSF